MTLRLTQRLRMTLMVLLALILAAPAYAVTLLRDADMEYALRQVAKPILSAAGLSPSQVRVLVVNEGSLNAFVVDTQHIFIHAGLMRKLTTAAQLQAVIAHEAAHITNGHITRRIGNARSARTAAGLGLLLAAAAGAASNNPQAAAGIALGTQGSATRLFLSHTRSEESSADISSVRILLRAGVDPQAAVEVQELFRGQEALSVARQDPYRRTHPASADRLRALKGLVAGHKGTLKPDATAQYWYARARGKLTAFTRAPTWTLRRAKEGPTEDIRLMREAVAHHRQSNTRKALSSIDKALSIRNDPFLMDLKGQILLESRQFGAAVKVYDAAARAAPREPLILGGLGRAHLASGNYKSALRALEAARGRDFSDARILRDLAVAYAKLKQPGMASVVTAERYALQGRMKDAAIHAKRAEGLLPRGSGPWQRAQDVLSAAKRAPRR